MFLSPSEVVEKPCREVLSHPVQCFQELFLATPGLVGTFFLGVGGFAVASIIWLAIFVLALSAIYYVVRQVFRGIVYFLHQTKVGQKILAIIPFKGYLQSFCCKAKEVQPKKLINTQAMSDYGANIVSKVHVDTKWFKSALKPFSKSGDDATSKSSPAKTPQRSTSRLSDLTPKIFSPKSHKE